MIVVKPVKITESILTSSIAEPDIDNGEEVWIDPKLAGSLGTVVNSYRTLSTGSDGNVYGAGTDGDIIKIDVNAQTVSFFGVYSNNYYGSATGSDGNIYFVGDAGTAIRLDVDAQSVYTVGSYSGSWGEGATGSDGNVYFGSTSHPGPSVLKINVNTQTISTFGSLNNGTFDYGPTKLSTGGDGNVYGIGAGNVIKVDVDSESVEVIASHSGNYSASATGSDGNIYFVGSAGSIMKLDVQSKSVSYFGLFPGVFYGAATGVDGNIYCIGKSGSILRVDIASQTVKLLDSGIGRYDELSTGGDGCIYGVGSGIGKTDEVLKIPRAYNTGDQVIKISDHCKYQAVSSNTDDPSIVLDAPTWVKIGPTNKYAMFDEKISTQSVSQLTQVVSVTPNSIIGGLACLNISGVTSINVTMTDPIDGVVYDRDIDLVDSNAVIGWFSYFYEPIIQKTYFVVLDLPPYLNATTTVTATGSGEVGIGALVFGKKSTIGTTDYDGTTIQDLDFDTWTEDEFGNLVITKRPGAKLVNYGVKFDESQLNYVAKQLEDLRGEVALYVGSDGDIFDYTISYGIKRESEIDVQPKICTVPVTVRGIV